MQSVIVVNHKNNTQLTEIAKIIDALEGARAVATYRQEEEQHELQEKVRR